LQIAEGDAQMIVGNGVIRVDRDRLLQQIGGILRSAAAAGYDAGEVQRVEMMRIRIERHSTKLRCLGPSPAPVGGRRALHGLRQRQYHAFLVNG